MTHIEQMIQDLCPNGVEWKTLGEVCKTSMGEFVKKDKQNPNKNAFWRFFIDFMRLRV